MEQSTGKLKWSRLATLMAGVALVVAACGTASTTNNNGNNMASSDKQILRINSGTEPNSLDPGQQSYDYEGLIGRNVFEPLLKPKKDLSDVEGAAASSYDVSSDGITYTFHIRQNAKWSDGVPLKAKDFVYGYQRILDPRLAAGYTDPFFDGTIAGAANYASIDAKNDAASTTFLQGLGLSAPDDHTFVVKLQQPAGYFKWVASLWVAAPIRKDIVEKYGSDKWATVPSQVIGNGMFKISEQVPKDHITLVPNDQYWGDKPHLTKIIDYFIDDANQAFSKYQTGELDIQTVPLANADLVQNDPKLKNELHKLPSLNTFWLTPNLHKAPFDNVKFREAVSHAIDRQSLATDVSKGQYAPVTTFIPKGMNGYQPGLSDVQKYDPAAAKAALQASGVSPAVANGVHYLARNTTANKQLAEYITGQIKTNLGLNWTIDVIDSKTVTSRIRKANFDIYGPDGWGADYPDPQDWYDIFTTGGCHGTNWGCPNNPDFDKLVQQADQSTKDSDRVTKYNDAGKLLTNQFYVTFLYQRTEWQLIKPYVQGYQATPLDEGIYLPGDFFTNTIFIANH
ncbi:MAG TPA: peptide ABC transporter substrate-binding protein [Candidatus Dormibacteraeota bacterium]